MQKQPSCGVLRKRCSKNMRQIYRRRPMAMLMCDFNKVALQPIEGCFWMKDIAPASIPSLAHSVRLSSILSLERSFLSRFVDIPSIKGTNYVFKVHFHGDSSTYHLISYKLNDLEDIYSFALPKRMELKLKNLRCSDIFREYRNGTLT